MFRIKYNILDLRVTAMVNLAACSVIFNLPQVSLFGNCRNSSRNYRPTLIPD